MTVRLTMTVSGLTTVGYARYVHASEGLQMKQILTVPEDAIPSQSESCGCHGLHVAHRAEV
jgi:hypothetical protein